MISIMNIKNIGIIEDLTVEFNNGFNVLTGETGAGKTLIIDSLGIISGDRFLKEMIRHGKNYSYVELNLFLPENTYSIDGNIVISREIYENGRNICKINGRLVTVNELKEFMSNIIDIHGQNDNQKIMKKSEHIKYLDNFIGNEIFEEKNSYIEMYNRYNNIKKELKNNYGDEKEKQRKLDLLTYQLNEISDANLKEDEEEELNKLHTVMKNSEKIYTNLIEIEKNLGENVIDYINNAIKCFEKIEGLDIKYGKALSQLKNIYYDVQELSRDVLDMNEELIFDENKRNEVEERLELIYSLKRKYGNTIAEIINYKNEIENEIKLIENSDERNNELKKELELLENKMNQICNKMNEIRKKYALKLSDNINNELIDLEMKNAKFYVDINYNFEGKFNENGLNDIEFLISTNIGNEAKPLIKIASGGEISRIMLAIKTVLVDSDNVPILIFDEIDTGISGKAAKKVGEKISIISNKHQVLCVTHQASIAAKGNYNYYINKKVKDGETVTNIKLLNEEETINEIARISSGDLTENSINHAKELRNCRI
ncbi:MAG: DNA repair protein RecN [Clostridiales bacterium]|nr:DNA repair protein RecN [Clostridiales bacterium]